MSRRRARAGRPQFTRENIVAVAARMFKDKGYRATSLQEVADVFGVQRPALYYHFANKAAILAEIPAHLLSRLTGDLDAISAMDIGADEKLERAIRSAVTHYSENIAALAVLLENQEELPLEAREPVRDAILRYQSQLEAIVEEGVRDGSFEDLDARLTVFAISGMAGWMYRWYDPDGRLSVEEIQDVFVAVARHGILVDDAVAGAA